MSPRLCDFAPTFTDLDGRSIIQAWHSVFHEQVIVKLIRDLAPPPELQGGAVAIGNFDGVHRGHAQIVARLRAAAAGRGPAVALTFDPSPAAILRPGQTPPPLSVIADRAAWLGELGVDAVWAFPATRELLAQSPAEFFADFLERRLQAKAVVEGADFRFGRDRTGDVAALAKLCQAANMAFEVVPPHEVAGQPVSSSRIRALLTAGDVAAARELLGRPHTVSGVAEKGAGRGAGLGFPTANLGQIAVLLPAAGVYAGRAFVADEAGSQAWPAAIHLGPIPTFGEQGLKLEVHLIGWQGGPLYGRRLTVELWSRLREVRKFANLTELQEQLTADVASAAQAAASLGASL